MKFLILFLIALQVALVGVIIAVIWRWLDMRSIQRSNQRKARLSIEGQWEELEEYFETAMKKWRPFVWLHYHYRFPGNFTVQHAVFLHGQGRLEEALAKVDLAIRQANGQHRILWLIRPRDNFKTRCGALRMRVLVLTGLGRYSEARESVDQLKELTGKPETMLALLELYSGRLDDALAEAKAVLRDDGQYDTARGVAAFAYNTKGDFDLAIQALSEEPADITKFYTPAGLKTMKGSAEGSQLLKLRQEKHARVSQPARFLGLAEAYLGLEDFRNADHALDQAEKSLGPEPAIQGAYCRSRACSLAGQGKGSEVEVFIERLRDIAKQRNARSFTYEKHVAAGRAYLYLGRFADALGELSEAQRSALHPIEKHVTAYLTARVHEAVGDRDKAIPFYQTVASDPIPSWMRKKAVEALG